MRNYLPGFTASVLTYVIQNGISNEVQEFIQILHFELYHDFKYLKLVPVLYFNYYLTITLLP